MKQTRTITRPFEVRADEGDENIKHIKGYAALFNVPTIIYERGKPIQETIATGAFDTANMSDVRCLLNHNADFIFGRSAAGTLTCGTDTTGLWYECRLDLNIQSHSDLYKSIERGDITQSSFAFSWPAGGATVTTTPAGEPNQRNITIIDHVYDVSPVTYPAYEETTVEARSQQFRAEVGANNITLTSEENECLNDILTKCTEARAAAVKLLSIATDPRLQDHATWLMETFRWRVSDIEWLQANAQPAEARSNTHDHEAQQRANDLTLLKLKAKV